jgi:hypothetical protein
VIWYVIEPGGWFSRLSALPGARVLASTAALPAADEAELLALERSLADTADAIGRPDLIGLMDSVYLPALTADLAGVDPAAVARIGTLEGRAHRAAVCRCAIVAFDPADDPFP